MSPKKRRKDLEHSGARKRSPRGQQPEPAERCPFMRVYEKDLVSRDLKKNKFSVLSKCIFLSSKRLAVKCDFKTRETR